MIDSKGNEVNGWGYGAGSFAFLAILCFIASVWVDGSAHVNFVWTGLILMFVACALFIPAAKWERKN